jgi:hypothetical protein
MLESGVYYLSSCNPTLLLGYKAPQNLKEEYCRTESHGNIKWKVQYQL